MKRIFLLMGALTLCVAALTPQSNVEAAAQVFRFRGGSQIAFATFSRVDGTLVTNAMITAIEGFNQSPPTEPKPTPTLIAGVVIFQYDTTCPPEEGCPFTVDANGFTETPEFQFNRDLSSAALKATVTMTDMVSGRSFPLEVDLNWIGIGDTLRNIGSPFKIREPGIIITITGNNYRRMAEVSGSVIDLDTNFDFSSQTTVFAELERASGNEIRVEFGR